MSFENTVGKGETARNEQFLLFPQCVLPIWKTFYHFINFGIVVCKLFQFGSVQDLSFGKGSMNAGCHSSFIITVSTDITITTVSATFSTTTTTAIALLTNKVRNKELNE